MHLIDEAEQVLSELGATSGFKIELAESDVLRFGPGNLMPGDLIYVDVGSGPIAEIVRQIDVECDSPGDGWTKVTPVAGIMRIIRRPCWLAVLLVWLRVCGICKSFRRIGVCCGYCV